MNIILTAHALTYVPLFFFELNSLLPKSLHFIFVVSLVEYYKYWFVIYTSVAFFSLLPLYERTFILMKTKSFLTLRRLFCFLNILNSGKCQIGSRSLILFLKPIKWKYVVYQCNWWFWSRKKSLFYVWTF